MRFVPLLTLSLLLACLASPRMVQAQKVVKGTVSVDAEKKEAVKPTIKNVVPVNAAKEKREFTMTPEREEAVNVFVATHHPELAELLSQLKQNKTRQYEKAVRELYIVSERLSPLAASDPTLHDLELEAWKWKSRIQLLAAKLTMDPDQSLREELKQALGAHYDVRRKLIAYERERLSSRMQKLDRELEEHGSNREAAVKKQFDLLTTIGKSDAEKRAKAGTPTKKPSPPSNPK